MQDAALPQVLDVGARVAWLAETLVLSVRDEVCQMLEGVREAFRQR
jgi:hypothetical protein